MDDSDYSFLLRECQQLHDELERLKKAKVYIAINYARDHSTQVVGASADRDKAREMVEAARGEPLWVDEHNCLNNYPADGPPDCVGALMPVEGVFG